MNKEDTIALIRSLVISKKGSYEMMELMRDFREEAGFSLPTFGYKTPLDFLKSIPDTLQVVQSYHKIMVTPVSSSKTAHIASLVRRQKSAHNRNGPGSRSNSERYYKTNFKTDTTNRTNFKTDTKKINQSKCHGDTRTENRTNTVKSSLVKWNHSKFTLEQDGHEVDYQKLMSHIHSESNSNNVESNVESKSPEVEIDISDDIVKDWNELPKLNLESFAKVGEYVEVCVPVICNAHNFTIQLRKFKVKLLNLMKEMQLFYNKDGDKYNISYSDLKSRQLCVALTKSNSDCAQWHRAIVLAWRNQLKAVVGLIDYGIITEINITNIRYMHHGFGCLPPQAISGHLANIQPFGGSCWSEESTERFLSLVCERDLIAGIVDVDYKGMWLSVALSFTDGTDVHISDTLVEENLAVFDSSEEPSDEGVRLPWAGNKGVFSLSHPIPKFWFGSKDISQSRSGSSKGMSQSRSGSSKDISQSRSGSSKDITESSSSRSSSRGQTTSQSLESGKTAHSEGITNLPMFSYIDSNVRLLEMFGN